MFLSKKDIGAFGVIKRGKKAHFQPFLTQFRVRVAAWGVPTASEQGAESEVAHKWARWLHNPCRLGDPHRFY